MFGCFRLLNPVLIDRKIFALLGLNIDMKSVFISLLQDFLFERKTSVGILPFFGSCFRNLYWIMLTFES